MTGPSTSKKLLAFKLTLAANLYVVTACLITLIWRELADVVRFAGDFTMWSWIGFGVYAGGQSGVDFMKARMAPQPPKE